MGRRPQALVALPRYDAVVRITILGATGRIGRHVLEQAVADGHDVTVLTRHDDALPPDQRDSIRIVLGGLSDGDAMADAIRGADAVISALGPRTNAPDQVPAFRDGMHDTITAMQHHGVRRIVNLSGAGVDAPGDRKPMLDRIASRLVRTFAGHVLGAKQAEFDVLSASDLEWVAVRPPLVRDGPRTGRYVAGMDVLRPGAWISRRDVAGFMLEQAVEPTFAGQAPFIRHA